MVSTDFEAHPIIRASTCSAGLQSTKTLFSTMLSCPPPMNAARGTSQKTFPQMVAEQNMSSR